jgi:hypothetical protein
MIGSRQLAVSGSLLLMSCFAVSSARAGAFADDLGTDVNGKVKMSLMNGNQNGSDSGRGPTPYLKALGGPPKRVALVSFYVWDCGNKKESAYTMYGGNYKYRVSNKRTINVESQAVDMLATEIYDASIQGMKEAFAANGMQLLTAEEFLDTEEKKATYANFKMTEGAGQKFAGFFQKSNLETWRFAGAPEGYRVFQMATVMDVKGNHFELAAQGVGVGKLAKSLGFDFAKALGVDAVAVLYNVVQAEKRSITMRGSYLYIFGPNPVPDTGKSLYWDGHQYSGVYIRMDVPFVETDKEGNMVSSDYDGYAVVAKALATRIGEHINEKVRGDK